MRTRHYAFFFFSSRRRHTRYWRDWSSDVCSSDLGDRSTALALTAAAAAPVIVVVTAGTDNEERQCRREQQQHASPVLPHAFPPAFVSASRGARPASTYLLLGSAPVGPEAAQSALNAGVLRALSTAICGSDATRSE